MKRNVKEKASRYAIFFYFLISFLSNQTEIKAPIYLNRMRLNTHNSTGLGRQHQRKDRRRSHSRISHASRASRRRSFSFFLQLREKKKDKKQTQIEIVNGMLIIHRKKKLGFSDGEYFTGKCENLGKMLIGKRCLWAQSETETT